MEFRMARGSEKDLTMSSLKIIRTIIESLFLYQEEKEEKKAGVKATENTAMTGQTSFPITGTPPSAWLEQSIF